MPQKAGAQNAVDPHKAGMADTPSFPELMLIATNKAAPRIVEADYRSAAQKLGVEVPIMRAIHKVEAPRGAFDAQGRISILYERHVFARNTVPKGRYNAAHPDVSGPPYGPGGYGRFDSQYGRFAKAYALDANAAIEACSWGAFQVLGENWHALGYQSPVAMVRALAVSEAAHLDSFVRFVTANHLVDELRQCRPGDASSWIPFVAAYNGPGFRQFNYHVKAAAAAQ